MKLLRFNAANIVGILVTVKRNLGEPRDQLPENATPGPGPGGNSEVFQVQFPELPRRENIARPAGFHRCIMTPVLRSQVEISAF